MSVPENFPFLTIVVPSRGRPESIRELAPLFNATKGYSTTVLVVAVDDDDPQLGDYKIVQADLSNDGIPSFKLVVGPRLRIGGTLNKVVPDEAQDAYAVGFMGDDHRPRTAGWDVAYVTELRRLGTGVVYGDDLIQGQGLPTQVAMTSDIVKATGHFVPDGMLHLWLDNAWKSLGEALGALSYLPQVVIEHMHPIAGKGEWDESYRENNADAVFDADKAAYEHWVRNDLDAWVQRVREYNNG